MWDLLLNESELMIADSVREYLSSELPVERLRPKATTVDLEKVRQGMADLGWLVCKCRTGIAPAAYLILRERP